jgi:hypothetical protein
MPNRPAARRRHWLWWGAPVAAVVGAALGWLIAGPHVRQGEIEAAMAAAPVAAAGSAAAPRAAASAASTAPFSASGLQLRQAQLALWQERLERAQQVLDAYRATTRYPQGSRPAAEQPDQMQPQLPIVEEHALREPGSKTAAEGVRLHTSQDRVFAQGSEGVRFTVALLDAQGIALPLRVLNASLREFTPPTVSSLYPVVPVAFNDEGTAGDAIAGDRIATALVQPSAQGFGGLTGQLRLEVFLEYRGERGFTYFDLYVTAEPPAVWSGGARESLEDGSLVYALKAQVREPGRYVVTGRIDDANGKPFALLTFNDEMGAGPVEFRLSLFGKLLRDAQPAFPLTLRDVEGFRLREEGHPDRSLMPRLQGAVLVGARHAMEEFSNVEWTGEERSRYLAELTRDVDEARAKVEQFKEP